MGRAAGRSILLVAHLSPPSKLVAARRVAGMAKFLARLGHSVTVLTSAISGEGPIEGSSEVIRTRDLLASPINWRRGHFDALRGASDRVYKPPSRFESIVVPDLAVVGWTPFALIRAHRLVRSRSFDCVVTSSPPQSAHLVGLAVRGTHVRWIAELRDGWTFEPPRSPWPFAAQRALDARIEGLIARKADAVVGVTRPIVDDLQSRLGIDAELIPNGFDPDEAVGSSPDVGPDELLTSARHSFVHTGRMGASGSSPEPLLNALRELRRRDPDVASRLEVVFAGPVTEEERRLLAAPDLEGMVRVTGSLERDRALRLQRSADTLLVITEGPARRSVATGKLFEYLAAGRPILVLGEETEAARVVGETETGRTTSASEPNEIADALRDSLEERAAEPNRAKMDKYSWAELARRYAELIERVCRGEPDS